MKIAKYNEAGVVKAKRTVHGNMLSNHQLPHLWRNSNLSESPKVSEDHKEGNPVPQAVEQQQFPLNIL